jgi:hypothetical protein
MSKRHRRGDLLPDLAHPVLNTVADADPYPARECPGERGDLHGGQSDVAHGSG